MASLKIRQCINLKFLMKLNKIVMKSFYTLSEDIEEECISHATLMCLRKILYRLLVVRNRFLVALKINLENSSCSTDDENKVVDVLHWISWNLQKINLNSWYVQNIYQNSWCTQQMTLTLGIAQKIRAIYHHILRQSELLVLKKVVSLYPQSWEKT